MVKEIYVITGGPCSGKTTLINFLKKLGYNVVEEAARLLVNLGELKKEDFLLKERRDYLQRKIMLKQLELESRIPDNTVTFLDRGLIDGIAYYWILNLEPPEELIRLSKDRNYKIVFILEQIKQYSHDELRYEPLEVGKRIHELIIKAYKMFNYTIEFIPELSVEERAKLILKIIEKFNK